MKYNTYEFTILKTEDSVFQIKVVAVDLKAAKADILEAYWEPEILSVKLLG